jgi:hypothetical protein
MDEWASYRADVRSNLIWMAAFLHKQRMSPEAVRINTPWAFLPQKEFRAIVKTFGKTSWDHLDYAVAAEKARALTKKEFAALKKTVSNETKLTFVLYETLRTHYRTMKTRRGGEMPKPPPAPVRKPGPLLLMGFEGEVKDELLESLLEEMNDDYGIDEDDEEHPKPTPEAQVAAFLVLYPHAPADSLKSVREEEDIDWTRLAPAVLARKDRIIRGEEEYDDYKVKVRGGAGGPPLAEEIE